MQQSISERTDITPRTKSVHISALSRLRKYGKIQSFGELTTSQIVSFDSWLRSLGLKQATITLYHSCISSYIAKAVRNEIIERNPYDKFNFPYSRNEQRKYLSEIDIEILRTIPIYPLKLSVARDLFVFQMFTGLAYADLAKFDFTKVRKHNGRFVLHDVRQKSKEDYYIVLLSPAMEILQRHNFKLPIVDYRKYLYHLHCISRRLNLSVELTTHVARHTFAVYAINHNVPIESLAKMMGHTNINTTQVYAKIANTTVERAFDILEQSIKNPTFLNAGSEINNSD
jgi:site-specific recombinase XerD